MIQPNADVTKSSAKSPGSWQKLRRKLRRDRWVYIFLLPTMALYALYTLWPITASWYYALLDWNGFERQGRFVGLANFKEVVSDPQFWNAFKNTFIFLAIAVPIRVFVALVLAIILNSNIPFTRIFRTAIFLPVVTTGAIIGVVMKLILDPVSGPVNIALLELGLIQYPIDFLGQAGSALYTAIGVWVWKWIGITLIYWLAALQTIPGELYEAGRIDGAGPLQLFWRITLPLLTPFTIIILLITTVDATNVFDLLLTLTGGGPFFSSEVVDIFVYRLAFASTVPRLGYASAAALFFGVTVLMLAVVQVIVVPRLRRRTKME